jgi:hypothetical protein
MTAVRQELPKGRYGHGTDAFSDRRLKQVGVILGVLALLLVGWYGWQKVTGTKVSAEVITFKAVSDRALEAHLEVRKDTGVVGVCTIRSQAADGTEVGRRDVRFAQHSGRIDQVITIRTTARGTTAELLGCHAAGQD